MRGGVWRRPNRSVRKHMGAEEKRCLKHEGPDIRKHLLSYLEIGHKHAERDDEERSEINGVEGQTGGKCFSVSRHVQVGKYIVQSRSRFDFGVLRVVGVVAHEETNSTVTSAGPTDKMRHPQLGCLEK